ncbi:MAG: cytochrome b562 [Cardiobacteriaceae bacterium]|nr:cytochrome b562 [Cardiobacteriaceae bacterium]
MKKIALIALLFASFPTFADTTPPQSTSESAIIDPSMDLNKTMKTMGRNFRTIERSSDWEERKTAVAELLKYTLQAKAQGLSNPDASEEDKATYEEGMNQLHEQITQLQDAINAQDADKVQTLIDIIKQSRRQGHQYFKVN